MDFMPDAHGAQPAADVTESDPKPCMTDSVYPGSGIGGDYHIDSIQCQPEMEMGDSFRSHVLTPGTIGGIECIV